MDADRDTKNLSISWTCSVIFEHSTMLGWLNELTMEFQRLIWQSNGKIMPVKFMHSHSESILQPPLVFWGG